MICPTCPSDLRERRVAGIQVDECRGCGGLWFDAGELEAYRASQEGAGTWSALERHGFVPDPGHERERCPRCEASTLDVGTAGDHALRKCSRCNGAFVSFQTLIEFEPSASQHVAAQVVTEDAIEAVGWSAVELLGWLVASLL